MEGDNGAKDKSSRQMTGEPECDHPELAPLVSRLTKTNRALKMLGECTQALLKGAEEQALLHDICKIVVEVGGYQMAWVGYAMWDPEKTIVPIAKVGKRSEYLEMIPFSWGDGPVGRCAAGIAISTGVPYVTKGNPAEPQDRLLKHEDGKLGFRSSISLPLPSDYGPIGALTVYSENPEAFDAEELVLLSQLAGDLSYGINAIRTRAEHRMIEYELHDSWHRLHRIFEGIVEAMSTITELRDPYTAGHQQRVCQLACAIAARLGFADSDIEGLRVMAILHDIGKVSVPTEVLCKPGVLSQPEFDLIKLHPRAGFNILKTIEFPWPVAQGVFQHHERLDGSGYPQGLASCEILPEARILAVADVVEAMSSHRPYRPAPGLDKALSEIRQNRKILYDPDVADACIWLFHEGGFRFA